MRALCTGDIHLGKGHGYADDRLGEQEQVWRRTLEVAEGEGCDAVLVVGDIFEGPLPTPEHYEAFARPLRDFPGLPVVACLGNGRHDAALRSTSAPSVIAAPNFTLHTTPGLTMVGGVTVCALPWAPVSRLVAARNGGDRDRVNEDAAEHLLAVARGLRAQAGGPAILLLHWSLSGASLPNGLPVDMAREPILPVEEIEALGFQAIVAGHIHKAQRLGEYDRRNDGAQDVGRGGCGSPEGAGGDVAGNGLRASSAESGLLDRQAASPLAEVVSPLEPLAPAFYTGSPMPLDFSEAAYEHGVWILDVEPDRADARFVPLGSRRFHQVDADLTWLPPDADLGAMLIGHAAVDGDLAGTILKVRFKVTAEQARRMDEPEVLRALHDAGAHRVYLQRETVRVARRRVAEVDETFAVVDAIEAWLRENDVEPGLAERVRERHAAYTAELAGGAL